MHMKKVYKVITLGDQSVGKTSIVESYINKRYSPITEPTLGACFYKKDVTYKNREYSLEIWDTAGQERYHSLLKLYYRNCDAVIVVFDITNRRSFERIREWVQELEQNCQHMPCLVLVGNKTDLFDDEKVSYDEAKGIVRNGWGFTYCSAKDQKNIDAIFEKAIELMVNDERKKEQEKEKKLEKQLKLRKESNKPEKKSTCC